MSQWKFNDFEAEIDFTDEDFIEVVEPAENQLLEDLRSANPVGTNVEILREQREIYDRFFGEVFGEDALEDLFLGKKSVQMRIDAYFSLRELSNTANGELQKKYSKYMVEASTQNREQRRSQSKNQTGYSNQRKIEQNVRYNHNNYNRKH